MQYMRKAFLSYAGISFGSCGVYPHMIQTTKVLLPLRCTPAAGLIQTRGAKSRFGSKETRDPYAHLRRKGSVTQSQRFQRIPLLSDERKQKLMRLPLNITSLNHVISDVLPLEKYAKAPYYTKLGMAQRWIALKENMTVIYSGALIKRKLKKVDPFHSITFARWAQEQFVEIFSAVQKKDKMKLRRLTTENTLVKLLRGVHNKQLVWEFVEELERPRVISARVAPFNTKDNIFAQLVVRLHSKQVTAMYGSSGKLLSGDPNVPREVINYVLFERHLVNPERTAWRMAGLLPPQVPWKTLQKAIEKRDAEKAQKKLSSTSDSFNLS